MSAVWASKALFEVCEIKPPKGEAKRKLKDTDFVSFVPMEDLGIDQKFVAPRAERRLGQVVGSYTYFADNDVLLAKITPCFENGKLGIARALKNGIGFGSSEYIVLRPNDELSNEYLFYFLLQDSFRAEGINTMSGAVGHKRVSKEFIERCQIPLPPLPEQQRIVAILDEAFAGLATATANAEKNLKNTRDLFDSYRNSLFPQEGDERIRATLNDIADFKNGLNFTKSSRGETIRIVGVKDFQNSFWVPMQQLEMVQIEGKLGDSYVLRKGDILTVRSNGNKQLIGRCILASDVPERTSHSGFTIRIRTKSPDIMPAYLVHYLKSGAIRKMLIESGDGANISSLNQQALSSLPVFVPPMPQQVEIVDRIDSFGAEAARLEASYRQKIDGLAELRQSILQKAFSGELTSPPSQAIKEAAE